VDAWLRAHGIEPGLFLDLMRRWLASGAAATPCTIW
jgi:hypothetical protein